MKKILIIEDFKEDFEKMRKLLGSTYTVIPKDFEEMSACIEYPQKTGKNIVDYTILQIDKNYRDLSLIICDIILGNDIRGGNKVVKAIRKHKIPGSPYWTSLVPIVAITHHAKKQESIIDAGADFSIIKENDENLFSALVESNADSFERRLESMFPPKLKDDIKAFKNKHLYDITAFIMTSFAEEHHNIINQITKILKKHKITPCLANKQGGECADDIWANIEVFIHGCDFGIGIYADDSVLKGSYKTSDKEQYKRIRINPNMSQEVGYMLGLQKKVCILKDKELVKLPADLAGKIYVEYENENDLDKKLSEWLNEKILKKT